MNRYPIALLIVVAAVTGHGCGQQQDGARNAGVQPAPQPDAAVAESLRQASAPEPKIDPASGFVMHGDWELVRANCTSCHSAKLVTQQRGTATQWLGLIRWMQATQNLWQFDSDTEKRIVAYLAENYPPGADRRRAAIPPDLMPRNPYSPTAQ